MLHTVPLPPLTKTQLLYGTDIRPAVWKKLPYDEALALKIKLAKKRIGYLYVSEPMLYVDHTNINKCLRAIAHNEYLLKEE